MELTDKNFKSTITDNKVVMVDFWAEWCGPCRVLAPTMDSLGKDFNGKLVIGKVNVDNNPTLSTINKVRTIPTVIVYKNGVEVERLVGVRDKTFYTDKLNYYLN
jgi:thioredoxin 1